MPNWCEINISFRSKKKRRLEKIANKMIKNKDVHTHYGHLQLFDTLYAIPEIVCEVSGIDKNTFDEYFDFLYNNCIYDGELNSCYMPISKETIKKVINRAKYLIENGQYPEVRKPKLIRMRSIIKEPSLISYRDFGKGTNPFERDFKPKNIPKLQSLWDWNNENIGVKWDIESFDDVETPEDLINLIYYCEDTNKFHFDLSGQTAWDAPYEFVRKVCKKYKVQCLIKFYEPGMGYGGSKLFNKKGEIVDDQTLDDDKFFNIKAERNMNYGDMGIYDCLKDQLYDYSDDTDSDEYNDTIEQILYLMKTTTDLDPDEIRTDMGWSKLFKKKK